jgi:hypothetical protein
MKRVISADATCEKITLQKNWKRKKGNILNKMKE